MPQMRIWRRHLHSNPELSSKEFETANYIREQLNSMKIPWKEVARTGSLAYIGKGEPSIVLRADIDALPISEENDVEYKSKNEGRMHACGHDFHTAMLLAAAQILKDNEEHLNGAVKLIFQHSEELLPGGALDFIKDGEIIEGNPIAVLGQHVLPTAPCGTIHIGSGAIMASTAELYWTVAGKSSHAASPQLGADPVLAASQLVVALQTLVTKFRSPLKPVILTVASFEALSSPNIIPERACLKGTLRTYEPKLQELFIEKIKIFSENICAIYGCQCKLEVVYGYPPVKNAPAIAEQVSTIAGQLFGTEKTKVFEPVMWAEDFAYYSEKIPGCFWFLGTKTEGDEAPAPLHNCRFNPDENAMAVGAALMAAAAIELINNS